MITRNLYSNVMQLAYNTWLHALSSAANPVFESNTVTKNHRNLHVDIWCDSLAPESCDYSKAVTCRQDLFCVTPQNGSERIILVARLGLLWHIE